MNKDFENSSQAWSQKNILVAIAGLKEARDRLRVQNETLRGVTEELEFEIEDYKAAISKITSVLQLELC